MSLSEQERQVEALTTLEYGLSSLYQEGMSFEGLSIQLYHPDMCPVESYAYMDEAGNYQMKTSYMKSYIADDGTVHLVADSSTICEQVGQGGGCGNGVRHLRPGAAGGVRREYLVVNSP